MSVHSRLRQKISNPAFYTKIRSAAEACFHCYLICYFKTDALDIVRQFIRIFLDHDIDILSVLLIDFNRQIHGNAILLQKNHGFSHILLFFQLIRDFQCHPLADAFYFCQSLRLFFYHPEGIFFEMSYDSVRKCGTDSFDRTRSEISYDRFFIFRLLDRIAFDRKLISIGRMCHVFSFHLDVLTFSDILKSAYACGFVTFIRHRKHCISIIAVSVYNFFHITA